MAFDGSPDSARDGFDVLIADDRNARVAALGDDRRDFFVHVTADDDGIAEFFEPRHAKSSASSRATSLLVRPSPRIVSSASR